MKLLVKTLKCVPQYQPLILSQACFNKVEAFCMKILETGYLVTEKITGNNLKITSELTGYPVKFHCSNSNTYINKWIYEQIEYLFQFPSFITFTIQPKTCQHHRVINHSSRYMFTTSKVYCPVTSISKKLLNVCLNLTKALQTYKFLGIISIKSI